jgi:ferric-dicitrate binding protein FerR (iron transport regulator)
LIIADGFSCREQIAQCTERHALHLAEVIQMALKNGLKEPATRFPEREAVQRREAAIRSSMLRAGSAVAGIAVAGGLLWALTRGRE